MIEKLREIANSLEAGETVPYKYTWSSDFDNGKYEFIFGIQFPEYSGI